MTSVKVNQCSPPKVDAKASLDLSGKHVHFVGIGGCGMSGLARLTDQCGAICSGTDRVETELTVALENDGIQVAFAQCAESIPVDCDLVVVSAAIALDHPELTAAKQRGIQIMKYAQLLGQLMAQKTGVAVAGTHGKSTTTSLLSHILIRCGLDPSLIVGAHCPQIGGGWRVGNSNLLIAEACEFDRSFHNLHPEHAVILNIEEDHLDMYRGIEEIIEAFTVFAERIPPHGSLLIHHEMPHRLAVTAKLRCDVQTLGFSPQADWRIEWVEPIASKGGQEATYVHLFESTNKIAAQWRSPMPGEHMAYNTAAAALIAHRLGTSWDAITDAIETFEGLDRRMQCLGRHPIDNGAVTVMDDYGHHPTEIDTTLRALRCQYHPNRLICVFQPHQHSRTRFLMEQFAASFSEADIVIVPEIYFVRDSEKERHAVRAADLVDQLRLRGKQAMHLHPFEAIVEQLQLIAHDGDLLVTMGAGDVWKVAHQFLGR